jgi:phenylpropionate dioxygenase-like ring-hydroxylating dioxygenase large terminal subunit
MSSQSVSIPILPVTSRSSAFPLNQWYVAGFSNEVTDKPLARTFLNEPVVLFRTGDGRIAALEDRCCHRSLPLSCGMVEEAGLRCGYHGMLYARDGACIEIPGQDKIPAKARVKAHHVEEKDHIIWIWFGRNEGDAPSHPAPDYPHHDNPAYKFGNGVYHYNAPYQLIHDNLLDLSHLGYVHVHTIGGNAKQHMNAEMRVTQDGDVVRVVRLMPGTPPPPTYVAAWPFGAAVDRWQEIEFHVSHLRIWTGAVQPGTDSLEDPQRGGFHMRGFHGVTPETETTSHYMWSMSANRHPEMPDTLDTVVAQTKFTFDEDRTVIEAQYENMKKFGERAVWTDIHVDAGANRARRIMARLTAGGG